MRLGRLVAVVGRDGTVAHPATVRPPGAAPFGKEIAFFLFYASGHAPARRCRAGPVGGRDVLSITALHLPRAAIARLAQGERKEQEDGSRAEHFEAKTAFLGVSKGYFPEVDSKGTVALGRGSPPSSAITFPHRTNRTTPPPAHSPHTLT